MESPKETYFKTLGVPELAVAGRGPVRLRYRKAYALLGYLTVERGSWHERSRLAAMLWPQLAAGAARANLRLVLKDLVDGMGSAIDACGLRLERNRLGLFPSPAFAADVFLLAEETWQSLRQCGSADGFARVAAGVDGRLDRMDGEFLAGIDADRGGEFEDWLLARRAFFARGMSAFLREYLAAAHRCGAREQAICAARVWTHCCPASDEAARAEMESLAASGFPAAAFDAYADFAQRLDRLVGDAPAAETEQLHARIAAAVREPDAGSPPRGEVRRVVVLHVEPDFEDPAEPLEPERYLEPLDAAFGAALARWKGCPLPTVGAALGAVFGLAEDGEQSPRRALRAAFELAALAPFRRARIGLCEGKALVSAAARQPIAGSVLPTIAQRLAMCGEPGDVVADRRFVGGLDGLGEAAQFMPLAPRRFAGLPGEYAPGRLAMPASGDGRRKSSPTPFVGRRDETARLTDALAAVEAERRVGFIEVVGPAGTGKTRLLAELARAHETSGGTSRWIVHRPELRHVSLGAVRDCLGEPANEGAEALSGRRLIDALIARLFAPAAIGRPLLLVFDDLHWGDAATLELIETAMQRPPAATALVILASRTPVAPADAAAVPRLPLPPLGLAEAAALVAANDPDDSLGPARRAQLAKLSGGLPLCAEYIARAACNQPVSDASLFGVLQSVLDGMGADKPVMQAASVLGAAFRSDDLGRLLPGCDVAAALGRAAALAIVEPQADGGFAFHHALLRDCAYESAPPRTLRDWHRQAAFQLQQQGSGAPADVAQHFEAAHAWGEARQAWKMAAEAAYLEEFAGDAGKAAARALAMADKQADLAVVEKAELDLLAGFAALMTEGYGAKGVQKRFAPWVERQDGLPDETTFRALAGMVAACPQGRVEGAAMMARLDAIARQPAQYMMVDYGFGSLLFWRGEFPASLRRLEAAIATGKTIRPREWLRYSADNPVVACQALRAINLAFSGTAEDAAAAAGEAIAAARSEGRAHGLCFALTIAAGVHLVLDRPEEVERLTGEGLELAEKKDFQLWQAYNTILGIWAKARQGRFVVRKAFRLLSMVHEFSAASRMSPVTSWWFVSCVFEAMGQWTLLETAATRGLAIAENGGDTFCTPDLMRQCALARLRQGDPADARLWIDKAFAANAAQGSRGLADRLDKVQETITRDAPWN